MPRPSPHVTPHVTPHAAELERGTISKNAGKNDRRNAGPDVIPEPLAVIQESKS